MALSMFRKKDQLVTPAAADDSAEKYEFLSPIQSKSKTRRHLVCNTDGSMCPMLLRTGDQ